jgi:hypothetical protein
MAGMAVQALASHGAKLVVPPPVSPPPLPLVPPPVPGSLPPLDPGSPPGLVPGLPGLSPLVPPPVDGGVDPGEPGAHPQVPLVPVLQVATPLSSPTGESLHVVGAQGEVYASVLAVLLVPEPPEPLDPELPELPQAMVKSATPTAEKTKRFMRASVEREPTKR